jgi:hypothetical protein
MIENIAGMEPILLSASLQAFLAFMGSDFFYPAM